jgi:anthranilate synthase component 1
MINFKNSQDIQISGTEAGLDYRSSAFSIYLNLLNLFNSRELLLLESLGPGSIDSKTSLIGINPVFNLEVFDLIVTITSNEELLKRIELIYQGELLIEHGVRTLRYKLKNRNSVWDFLRLLDSEFKTVDGGVLAFTTLGYSVIHFVENIAGYVKGDMPDISLTCYSNYIEFDDDRVRLHEYGYLGSEVVNLSRLKPCLTSRYVSPTTVTNKTFEIKRETHKREYLHKAITALNHVRMGDVYQIQIGHKINIRSDASAIDVYTRLRSFNPSPYMYLFQCGNFEVIGASPELFIYMRDDEVLMRPIAGTLGKSVVPTKDAAIEEFRDNVKEVAEHMMLVDLCRNDLCKISFPHSLHVPDLMSVEEYSHVYHMVSTTQAVVRREYDKYDVIKASFPAGTMTGTPKIRAIELISELEDSSRGLYAGALGIIGLGVNYINTALCIRTAIKHDQIFTLRASAGIVSDSLVQSEYAETLQKMGSVFKAITDEEISCHIV